MGVTREQAMRWVAPVHLECEGLSSSMVKVAKLAGVYKGSTTKKLKRVVAEEDDRDIDAE